MNLSSLFIRRPVLSTVLGCMILLLGFQGLFNLSVVLPQLVASLGIGQIIGRMEDKSITFVICALCLAVSAVSWMLVKEEQPGVEVQGAAGGGGH